MITSTRKLMRMIAFCDVKGTDNHSDDRMTIHTGRHEINEDGTVKLLPHNLCGFHAQKKGLI